MGSGFLGLGFEVSTPELRNALGSSEIQAIHCPLLIHLPCHYCASFPHAAHLFAIARGRVHGDERGGEEPCLLRVLTTELMRIHTLGGRTSVDGPRQVTASCVERLATNKRAASAVGVGIGRKYGGSSMAFCLCTTHVYLITHSICSGYRYA